MTDDTRFQVVDQSGAVTELLWQVVALAKQQRRARSLVTALRWIQGELERTPHEFGEGRYAGEPTDGLLFRIAFARPLCVEFAFDLAARQVFIRRWQLLR